MKRKIICLLLAVLCIVTVVTACKKEEEEPQPVVCEGHIDADKNFSCDNCETPVLTIVEKVATEQSIVESVISAIPETATLATIYNCNMEKPALVSTGFIQVEDFKDRNTSKISDYIFLIEYDEPITSPDPLAPQLFRHVTRLYNALTGQDIVPVMTDTDTVNYNVDIIKYIDTEKQIEVPVMIKVETVTHGTDVYMIPFTSVSTKFYTATGVAVGNAFVDVAVTPEIAYSESEDMYYVVLSGIKYAINGEDMTIVHSEDKYQFVMRPKFDDKTDKYSYLIDESVVYVYDNTKWLECVYSYRVDNIYEAVDFFVLANSNILVQGIRQLPSDSVNYDYTAEGGKFDIDYILVDVATKTAKSIEFGYYIDGVDRATTDMYAATVKNVVYAKAIKNRYVADEVVLYTDDALTILGEYNKVIPNSQVKGIYLIANNRFLAYIEYGEGSSVRQIYDEKGALIATLPQNATIGSSYILVGEKVYDFSMKLIYDIAFNGYTAMNCDTYLILRDALGNEYYYIPGMTSPALIAERNKNQVSADGLTTIITDSYVLLADENVFVLCKTVETQTAEGSTVVSTYNIYNASNNLVATTTSKVEEIEYDENGLFMITLEDGTALVKRK